MRSVSSAVLVALACAAAAPAGRSAKEIATDLQGVEKQIAGRNFPDSVKYNPLYAKQMAGTYGSLYAQEQALLKEFAVAVPKSAPVMRHRDTVDDARLAFWGVGDAQGRLDALVAGPDKAVVADGKLGQSLVEWWKAIGDADRQVKVAADVEQLGAAAPTSNDVADTLHLMLMTNPASVAIGQRLTDDLVKKLSKSSIGKAYAAVPNKIDEPLAVEGSTLKGPTFKSGAWLGKVVLIDFWATWCPPCREEIPHVAKLYQQYHAQGFEVIGVSSDQTRQELAGFLQQHAEMPWPELFQGGSAWHPLTKKFGIDTIPTMYLLDRNGILRTLDAQPEMDKLIPELLAEAYTPAVKKTAAAAANKPTANAAKPTGGVPTDDINLRLHQAAGAGMN